MSALPLLRRRRERRSFQRQRRQGRRTWSFLALGLVFAVLTGGLLIGGALAYASVTENLPSLDNLPELLDPVTGSLLQPTRIYDRTGSHLLLTLAPEAGPRLYLSLSPAAPQPLPDPLVRATLARLDPGFWSHPGFAWSGLTRPDQHPTLAQKLAVDLLLWDEAPSLRRAFRERLLAAQLTARFGREKILEWYLNSANYGHYAYGAEAASRLYLGKPASQLNLAEAALLAGVNEFPAINPLDAPQAASQRGLETLTILQATGLATDDEIALARYVPVNFQTQMTSPGEAPALTALALAQLETRFNRARVERGGMVVLTTLDFNLQRRTECALRTQLARLNAVSQPPCAGAEALPSLPPGQNLPQAAASAVVLDPRNGQLLALVGDSKNGTESVFLAPHRPGTLLTPFVYLAGFTRGLSPATLVWDIPPEGADLSSSSSYHGPLRLRTALVNDYPSPARQVFDQMGAALVQQTLVPFGLGLSAVSQNELLETGARFSVLDLARAYGVFAAQGALVGQPSPDGLLPSAILALRGLDGRPYAEWSLPGSEQIVSGQLAYLLTDALSLPDLGRPAALKIGQTPDGTENWAVGYTPQRVAAVWMGGENGLSRASTGLWTALMQTASRDQAPDGWSMPVGMLRLKVCDPSGLLPTEACPNLVDEIFIEGYQPVQADTLYRAYAINRETGFLATVFTPPQLVEKRVYLVVPPEAQAWARLENLSLPPTQYDTIQPPAPNPEAQITSPGMLDEVQGRVTLRGSASGADFASYRLQYGQGLNPETWILIGADVKNPVSAGPLAEWETTGLKGLYSVQLLVVKTDHSLETSTVQVTVNNP
jgi:membrane carboxypeptidase/penicillin-binding protein